MPSKLTTGTVVLASIVPNAEADPRRPVDETALTATIAGPPAIPCGSQVPDHWPFPIGSITAAGSPDENVACTAPAVSGEPQSSRISTCKETGSAAGSSKSALKFASTGTSCVGLHTPLAGVTIRYTGI